MLKVRHYFGEGAGMSSLAAESAGLARPIQESEARGEIQVIENVECPHIRQAAAVVCPRPWTIVVARSLLQGSEVIPECFEQHIRDANEAHVGAK